MAAAQLDPPHGIAHRELVVNVLLADESRVDSAEISLLIDVPAAEVVATRLGEREIKFELADAEAKGIPRQLHEAPNIDEFQVRISEAARRVVSTDADVVVNPERDVAAEIPRCKDTEQAGREIRSRNKRRNRSWWIKSIEVAAVLARQLEE